MMANNAADDDDGDSQVSFSYQQHCPKASMKIRITQELPYCLYCISFSIYLNCFSIPGGQLEQFLRLAHDWLNN